jgi:uncharacterized protein (TIGR00730 family)
LFEYHRWDNLQIMSIGDLPKPDDFLNQDAWRVFRILSEFVDGFENMASIGPSVSIFGSAVLKPDSPYYELATTVAKKIAEKKFAIITGGGPGIMEAANKGAVEAKGSSCGLSVTLPLEWEPNRYVDSQWNLKFRYFFVRKVMFVRYAQGYVFLPGGVGTMDELFEALTLIQTEKLTPFPIYLLGSKYWEGLRGWLEETVFAHGCITQADLDRLNITDDPDEVAQGIEHHYRKYHALRNF